MLSVAFAIIITVIMCFSRHGSGWRTKSCNEWFQWRRGVYYTSLQWGLSLSSGWSLWYDINDLGENNEDDFEPDEQISRKHTNDCQGGGRGPGRFGRKKFSQHSLRSCWQEFSWTRQVKIVLTVMTMLLSVDDNEEYYDNKQQLWPGTSGPRGKHKRLRRVGPGGIFTSVIITFDLLIKIHVYTLFFPLGDEYTLFFLSPPSTRTFGSLTDPNCAQPSHNPPTQLS